MVGYDYADNFGYAYDLDDLPQKIYIGAALISDDKHGFYAINQDSTNASVSPNSSDGFNDFEKWEAISSGIKKNAAGPADISYVISAGPYSLNSGKAIDVAFVLACGETKEDVRAAIRQSRLKWSGGLTDAADKNPPIPKEFVLYQNYPNPFNPLTNISYKLPVSDFVTLKIYDVLGREVATPVNEYLTEGFHTVWFDAKNLGLSSGIYFYKLNAGKFQQTKKFVLMK